jgi:hypothetical protein
MSIEIVGALNSYINDVSLAFSEFRTINRRCATALWNMSTLNITGNYDSAG